MRIKTVNPVLPKIENSIFPYSYDEFLSALSVCEIFLFTDRSVTLIPRRVKGDTELSLAQGFLKRVYEKFHPETISKIKDQQFQKSYQMIVDYFIKTKIFGKIVFKGDEHDHYLTQADNMWKHFNYVSSQFSQLKNIDIIDDNDEFKKIYRKYRQNISKPKNDDNTEKKSETINLNTVVEENITESIIEPWLKNFDKTKIPKPIDQRARTEEYIYHQSVNPRMVQIVDMVRSGKYKSGIEIEKAIAEEEKQKDLEKLKANLEAINKAEEASKIKTFEESDTTKKYAESMDKLSNKLTELQTFITKQEITQKEITDLKTKLDILQQSIYAVEKPKSLLQRFISWFR